MNQRCGQVEFKRCASVTFCEKVGKRWAMEITTVNGTPYVNMAAYYFHGERGWVRDFKKNYFMPAEVFMIMCAKWPNVSMHIKQQLKKCMKLPI